MSSPPYSVKYRCTNCGYDGPVEFLFGQVAPDVCSCPQCGIDAAEKLPLFPASSDRQNLENMPLIEIPAPKVPDNSPWL